jgi:hypothetical protein
LILGSEEFAAGDGGGTELADDDAAGAASRGKGFGQGGAATSNRGTTDFISRQLLPNN